MLWPTGLFRPTSNFSSTRSYSITDDNIAEPDETIIVPVPVLTTLLTTDTFTTISTGITITIAANDGYVDPNAPVPDNPTARAERLEAPVAAVARGVGQLAADAITQRGDSGRSVSIWGSGGYVSADGDHKGVDYDGATASSASPPPTTTAT